LSEKEAPEIDQNKIAEEELRAAPKGPYTQM